MMKNRKCAVCGCGKKHKAKGYCNKHYQHFKAYGNMPQDGIYFYQKHGMLGTRIYQIWADMKRRCYHKKCKAYKNYGGRGIVVCDRWKFSFVRFIQDMGEPPTENHEIDRINNNGDYEPNNCRWVTKQENNQNKRTTKFTTEDIVMIKKSNMENGELAKIFETRTNDIRRIRNGERWANVSV